MREVLVIGGGLAGAALAIHLARAGRDVLLIERSPGPHDKVCGEFLSFEAQADLAALGLDLPALGAEPIGSVAVTHGRRRVETALGFVAQSLSRRVLDEALLDLAVTAGAEVRRGLRAARLERDGDAWIAEAGGTMRAHHVALATGKHDLRGWGRPPGRQPDLIGLKSYWRLPDARRLADRVELHLFPGGYAGLQPVEGGRANLCLVIRDATFAALGRQWGGVLSHLREHCPALDAHLAGAVPCAHRPLAVAGIPYGLVQEGSDGPWRLGDQAAVIPSFTGEGMSIALHSAKLAAANILSGEGPDAFQRNLGAGVRTQVRRSTWASQALVAPSTQAVLGRLLSPPLLRLGLRGTRMAGARRPRPAPDGGLRNAAPVLQSDQGQVSRDRG